MDNLKGVNQNLHASRTIESRNQQVSRRMGTATGCMLQREA